MSFLERQVATVLMNAAPKDDKAAADQLRAMAHSPPPRGPCLHGARTMPKATAVARIVGVLLLAMAGCVTRSAHDSPSPREWYREGAGRTVVMLGGGIHGAAMFAPHARELSNEFDVVRVQTLNVQAAKTGDPMPPDYSVASEALALEQTLSSLGISTRFDLVGSSFGAVVALHFAATRPGRVRTITLFEPPVFWILSDEDYKRDPVAGKMRELTSEMTPAAAPSDDQLLRFRALLGAGPIAIPDHADPARAEWDLSRRAMRGLAALPAHREDQATLARMEVPVLLLTGSETVPFHRRMNDLLAGVLPRVERAELPGGHSAPRTASSAFNQHLRAFLARHE